jgi:hypothetical protein
MNIYKLKETDLKTLPSKTLGSIEEKSAPGSK